MSEFPVRDTAIYNASFEHHLADHFEVTKVFPGLIMLRVVERTNIPLFAEITERRPNAELVSVLDDVGDLTWVKVLSTLRLAGFM